MVSAHVVGLVALVRLLAADPVVPAVDFAKEVAPILERHCVRCHQPGNAKGKVSLDRPAHLLAGDYVVPGKPGESGLFDLVTPSEDGEPPRMPKEGKPLSAAEVATLRRWVEGGAKWPEGVIVRERAKGDRAWWSLQPLATVTPPDPPGLPPAWAANPIDRFLFAKLRDKGLTPNGPAAPRALVRRVTLDLTGLPPTPEAVAAFVADPSDEAYARLVEKLLASPAYGEHWGRHWLDVVRFGESIGYERNVILDNAWPFRDYVIKSFHDDKPFDRLVREHLAGDKVGPGDPAVEVGVAFLVVGPYDDVGNQDAAQAAIIRANALDDMVRATSEAFLGVTVGCARCHDHKFDPIAQQDYHRLQATFAGVTHGERAIESPAAQKAAAEQQKALQARKQPLVAERAALRQRPAPDADPRLAAVLAELHEIDRALDRLPPAKWWVGRTSPAPGPFHLFVGGDPQKKGDPVSLASPDFTAGAQKGYRLADGAPEADRRLALAEWIVAPDNPLTPRVLANRVWAWHFGTGLVDTPSDFGAMGTKPSHPELLDWLAAQLRAGGWRLKPLHRLIVSSRAYRQSSEFRAAAAGVDGDARLLWRFPPRRLSGEEVRDAMLAAAGKLDRRAGGPGFRLYRYAQDNVATYHPLDAPGPETYRRAVYHQNARAARVDVLTDFDCPDPAGATPRRASTTTPLQSLTLFNHQFTLDVADALAVRAKSDAGADPGDQLTRAYHLVYGRAPTAAERAAADVVVAAHGLRSVARALLNSNEFLYVD